MTRAKAKKVLRQVFNVLTDTQRARLRWHAAEGTRILCGENAHRYTDGIGGG